jgi:long-chain acyl-CoA synthetase
VDLPLDVGATFAGKSMILLGATGFLGKVWLSMLLHRYPEVGTIYMMVRARKDKDPSERFWQDIATSPVFDPLRANYPGEAFNEFLRSKIVPIGGDIAELFLGLSHEMRMELRGKIDVIVNVSGVVDFNPPLDEALEVNAFGTQNLIELARSLGGIPVLHTSTCFVVGCRDGVTPERNPLEFPFPRADELDLSHWDADREISECMDLVDQAKRRVEDAPRQSHLLDEAKQNLKDRREPQRGRALHDELEKVKRNFVRQQLIEAGKERAQFWGWANIYTYTKSIGEQVLMRSGLRCCIVRPAIVESAIDFPVTGWCEGISTSSPISYLIFKGQQNLPIGDQCHYDAIPVDYCAAGMIAALAALLANRHREVYQLASSDVNPLKTKRAAEFLGLSKRLHFKEKGEGNFLLNQLKAHTEPMIVDLPTFKRRSSPAVHRLLKKASELLDRTEKTALEDWAKPLRDQVAGMARTTGNVAKVFEEFVPFIAGNDMRFSARNTRALMAALSPKDREYLPWKPEAIDWRHFWIDIHLPGMQKWSFPLLEDKLRKDPKPMRRHDDLSVMLVDLAEREDHAVALQRFESGGLTRITYRELLRRANVCAARLHEMGVVPGDRVAIGGRNHPDWAIAFFGIMRAGATAVPVDKDYDALRLTRVLQASRSKVALFDEHVTNYDLASCPRVELHVVTEADLAGTVGPFDAPTVDADSLASILYTSGTTGDPKGVMLTHRNFTSLVAALAPLFRLDHRDRLLSVLPLHHTFEFTCGLLLPLSRGARVIYLDEVNSDRLAEGLKEGRATALVGVPALWEALERRILNRVAERGEATDRIFQALLRLNRNVGRKSGIDLGRVFFAPVHQELGGHLRTLISGAAALPSATYDTFSGLGLHLAEGYGLTEASPVLSVAKAGVGKRAGSVGKPVPGVELKLKDANDNGVGEIIARGPNVMRGYADNETATNEVLQEGWLHTGDLGHFDRKGRLRIVGRSKEVIISTSGENVYPDDVETQLGKPKYIKELSIVGVPDQHSGELVACLAVPESDEKLDRGVLHTRALASLREAIDTLPRHTRPALVFLVNYDLPRTSTKKIQRKEVKSIIERLRTSAHALSTSEAKGDAGGDLAVRQAVAAVARRKVSELAATQDLVAELGFDSLMVVDLSTLLEDRFPGLDATKLSQCRTVGELEAAVATHRNRPSGGAASTAKIEREEDDEKITLPSALANPLKRAIGLVQNEAFNAFMRTKVYGRANIPKNRACIVVANHSSHLDVGLIKYGLGDYGSELVSMGAVDYFFTGKWRKAYFENLTNVEPLDRKAGLRRALQQAGEQIDAGKVVLIFPEGTRSPDGQMRAFLPLVGHLALTHRVDILPIYLEGAHAAFPKGATLPKVGSKLAVKIGPVLTVDDLERVTAKLRRADAYREIARLTQRAVESLRDGDALDLSKMEASSHVQFSGQESSEALAEAMALSEVVDGPTGGDGVEANQTLEPANVETIRAPVVETPPLSPMAKLMSDLGAGFVVGATEKPVSFYLSVGEGSEDKWTVVVDADSHSIRNGRPKDGKADCVLKTNLPMLTKIIRERYTPSFGEFTNGTVKTNNPAHLKVFKKVFGL